MHLIRKISLKTAGSINIAAIIMAAIVHLLVILQVMPYTWINGGRSASLEVQQQISMTSIFILVIMALTNFCIIKTVRWNKVVYILRSICLWLLFIYSIIGAVMQLFGTPFEKICMSVLCVVNTTMYFRLAVETEPSN